ncbi:putative ankyrin repeat protein MM_0045 [Colletotrichum liriopes]|uniref:Ankyrin repeat protein MM_0045 n=1 Tax=Colletotrichum liriopes TaxID=708192 RepID=A0AA37GH97_9PEZI|nr:putative ankyrin repeat protein MM_0045 [Colletotrichum liriopes]
MQEYPSVTIVLDALDEVQSEDRRELMDTLSWLLQNAPNLLKIFISSRDNYDISLHLQGSPNIYIEADDNAGDIEAFMFRWVALQIQSLRVLKLAADIQARLGVLPATLEESYWEVYQQINASGAHATNLATFTFRWLMYAKRTESIEDFAAIASSYLSEGGSKYTVEEVIDVCSNLVVQRSGTESFEFAHLSVREFLESVHRRGVDLFLSTPSNSSLASACIQHIKLEVEKELATWKEEPVADAAGGPVPKIPSLLQHYTTLNWYLHVQDSNENGRLEHLSKLLQTFILGEDGSGRLSRSFRSWWQMLPTEEKKSLGDTGTEPSNDHVAYPRKLVRMVCVLGCPETVELVCKYRRLTLNDGKSEGLLVNDQSASWLEDLLEAFRYAVRRLVIRDEMEVVDCIGRYLLETARAGTSSPLVIAVELDSLNAVRRLLHQEHGGIAVEALAVVNAARRDSIQALQLLIDYNKTAIQQAGQEAVRASVAFDSVQERKDQDGIEVVTALLDNDVPITSGDKLMLRATAVNHPALVQLLLNRGIGMGAISQALVLSISDGNDEITELLLHHGAKKTDSFAVIRALKQDTPTTAVRLIRAGYAYRGRYLEKARTALHYAAEKGFPEAAAILIERNTPMDLFDRDRKTPLHLAAEKGRHDCVQLLLKAGADVLIQDGAGNIALDLAERKGFEKTANSIRGHMEKMLEDLKEKQKHRRDIQHQDT